MFSIVTPSGRRVRRQVASAALTGASLFLAFGASAQVDLDLLVDANIPTGTYRNITIHGPAVATITGQVQITGLFHLKTDDVANDPNSIGGAGIRITDNANYIYGPGSFLADSASDITYTNTEGIDGMTAGAIRTPVKTFDIDTDFTYSGSISSPLGTLGNSFPDVVRNLTINRPSGATLTHNTAVRELITMRNGNLLTDGYVLTLISAPPDIPGLTAASTTVANLGGPTSRIIGPATVQRYINPRFNPGVGYRHYSSSVTGSTVRDLRTAGFNPVVNPQYNTVPYEDRYVLGNVTPFPNVFYYDQAQVNVSTPGATARTDFDRGWQSPASLNSPLEVGKGYTVYVSTTQNIDFVGQLNQNDQYPTPLMTGSTETDGGWYLVGNPYPSKIDWNLVQRTLGAVRDQISQYRSTQGVDGFFSTYIDGIGANGGSPIIAQNQGFFIRLNPNTTGRVTFTETARLLNFAQDPTAPFYRPANNTTVWPLLRLSMTGGPNNALTQETVVRFKTGATLGFDADLDATHIFSGYPLHFTSLADGQNLDINSLPEISTVADYTLPLVAETRQAGTYTLNASELSNFPSGYQVLLQDAVAGITQDLTLNPTYTYTTAANVDQTRFSIHFKAQTVTGVAGAATASNDVQVYPNPLRAGGSLNISVPAAERGAKVTASLVNQVGQRVWSKQYTAALGGVRETIAPGLTHGVYTLQIAIDGGATVARRVVVE